MTLEEALAGKEIPNEIRETLALVTVPFFSFDSKVREGQFVVHRELAAEVLELFGVLCEMKFSIEQIVPIVRYEWDDETSMDANNSSAFNYRCIACTDRLSNHSYGRALDINPMQNPYTRRDGLVVPTSARYDMGQLGTVTPEVVALFKSYGWVWGGDWEEHKDYQHFEKRGD